jgi:RHS repeat-associated protein
VITPDGTTWRYCYDPLGRRIAKQRLVTEGETVEEQVDFTWDGTTLCEQTTHRAGADSATVTLTWDHHGLHPLTQTERKTTPATATGASQEEIDSRFYAIVTDLIGTPTELVDEFGDIAWRTRTTLWGTTTWNRTATAYTPLRFPGQYFDPETGLHYNYFRHYDPETARYTTPDPLGLEPAPNSTTYVHNPHAWTDPLGLTPCEIALGYQWAGTAKFAEGLGLKHFLELGPTEWQGPVLSAIQDGSVRIHVNMEGFSGGFEGMAKRGLGIEKVDGPIHATEEEMGWIARAVKHGHRDWSSITWRDAEGRVIDIPEPDWATFGRVRDFII